MNPQDYNQNTYNGGQNPQNQDWQNQPNFNAQNGQWQNSQPQQFSNGAQKFQQAPQQNFDNYGQNSQVFNQFPQQNQPNFPQQGQQFPQNPAQNTNPQNQIPMHLLPNQQYSGAQSENPYTVEYLNSIAPKQTQSFWTKSKIMMVGFIGVGLVLALSFMIFGNRTPSNNEATVKLYHNLVQLEKITRNYQKKIKGSDLSAINAGMSTSLAANRKSLTDYMTSKKIEFLEGSKLEKSEFYIKNSKDYTKMTEVLDDAFFKTILDEVYIREMSYQLSVVKGSISKLKTRLNSKSASEKLDEISANFEISIKALKDLKN